LSELKKVEAGNLMTPQQAADYLGIKLSTIYSLCMRRQIPFCKIGKLNRFRRSDLNKWIESHIQEAGRYFFLCKASFAGDVERGGFGMPSKGTGRNPARTFRTAIDSLDIIAYRLKNAVVECLDYSDCIQRYDSPNTLFYVDTPYLNTEDYYGKGCFTLEDHHKLAELLHNIKGHAMVTHYQNALYDELYQGWNRCEYQSFKNSHKSEGEEKPKTVEVLYCNFESRQRGLFNGNIMV